MQCSQRLFWLRRLGEPHFKTFTGLKSYIERTDSQKKVEWSILIVSDTFQSMVKLLYLLMYLIVRHFNSVLYIVQCLVEKAGRLLREMIYLKCCKWEV